jgi:hypothetical protein
MQLLPDMANTEVCDNVLHVRVLLPGNRRTSSSDWALGSGLQAYEAMPIEDFGRAMLLGMGWKDGMGVGRNRKVKSAALLRRAAACLQEPTRVFISRPGRGANRVPAPP